MARKGYYRDQLDNVAKHYDISDDGLYAIGEIIDEIETELDTIKRYLHDYVDDTIGELANKLY